jgi:hypothetical protein
MATCPKCGMNFAYSEPHACERTDHRKVWIAVLVTIGALVGGAAGRSWGLSIVSTACDRPDAGNLCGLVPSSFVPGYVLIGGLLGALVAGVTATLFMSRLKG